MSTVLVTGGAGYIGGLLVDNLEEQGHSAIVYDDLIYEDAYHKKVCFVRGDIRDRQRLKWFYDKVDVVIWLAALVGDPACQNRPVEAAEINAKAVQWLAEDYTGRIVFPSTCSVYGVQNDVLTEEAPTNPLSAYAETKLEAESYLKDKNAIIFRLGTLYGQGDIFSRLRLDLVVNYLTIKGYIDKKITVFGGSQYRPLMHVGDVARAAIKAMDTSYTGIYNLAAKNITISELAREYILCGLKDFEIDCEIECIDKGMEDLRNYRVKYLKAMKDWGFNPQYSIYFGVRQMIELVHSGRLSRPKSWRFNNAAHLDALEGDKWTI